MTTEQILEQSEQRKATLFPALNQLTGEGSPIPRFPFRMSEHSVIHLPDSMKYNLVVGEVRKAGTFQDLLSQFPREAQELTHAFLRERCAHDFEFWAYSGVKIQDKQSKDVVPFKLRAPQIKLLRVLENMRLAGLPMRIILVKARQWGGSTLVQLYMGWIQTFLKKRWHSTIIADQNQQAANVRGMYNLMAKHHPEWIFPIRLSPFENQTNVKVVEDRECIISIGSMQSPDSLRSFDIMMAHLTEVGLWKKTEGKTPKDVVQSVRGTLLDGPLSLEVIESTAKGVGNFFHEEYLRAESGDSQHTPVFVAFFEIELYQKTLTSEKRAHVAESMTEWELEIWDLGAPLEAIAWHREKRKGYSDNWRMQSEYPESAEVAFQSTGKRVFPMGYVRNIKDTVCPPLAVGRLISETGKQTGKESLTNLVFEADERGPLKIWAWPDRHLDSFPDKIIKHRYGLFADIGGASAKADKSDICVMDRIFMLNAGMPEVVCTYSNNLDQDLFAWDIARVSEFYYRALAAIEVNSVKTKQDDTEGDAGYTILDEIAQYCNLFSRTSPEQIREGVPNRWGFHTNSKTKTMIINSLKAAMRSAAYIERDQQLIDQANTYEIKADGSFGAVDGQKDDTVITRAGAYWLVTKYMPLVQLIDKKQELPRRRLTSEAVL